MIRSLELSKLQWHQNPPLKGPINAQLEIVRMGERRIKLETLPNTKSLTFEKMFQMEHA